MGMRQAVTFHVYASDDPNRKQRWRWRAVSRNGRIVADGGEGYATKTGARHAAERLVMLIGQRQWEVVVD